MKESDASGKEVRPSVFVGSSSEGLTIPRDIALHLEEAAEVTVWKDGIFQPGVFTLEALIKALDRFDFAVLVLTPDDLTETRGQEHLSPRDNVLFELVGHLSRM